MKNSADFKALALNALKGKWGPAVIAGLIATLLGAISGGPEINFNFDSSHPVASLEYAGQTIISTGHHMSSEVESLLVGGAVYILLTAIAFGIISLILGSVVEVGYAQYNLNLVDGEVPSYGTLFSYFSYWKTTTVARLLQMLYILLWTLLFIIPGILASYSYALTSYLLAERPELTPSEAITLSKELMKGNRWRLFCLHFSFIGWEILCALTLGVGNLWLTPYKQAATAAFYREITDTQRLTYDYQIM